MIEAGACADLTRMAEVETESAPINSAKYGFNKFVDFIVHPLINVLLCDYTTYYKEVITYEFRSFY